MKTKQLNLNKIYILYLSIFLFFFTIYKQIELQVIPGPVDDLLYLKNAINIILGNWLGDYGQYTLSKGIGYPLFMAIGFILDIDTKNLEFFVYAVTSLYFSLTVSKILKNNIIGLFIFFFLISNPFLFDYQLARFVREGLYGTLVLLIVTFLINIIFLKKRSIKYSFILSIFLFWFWTTREEQIWMIVSIFVVIALLILTNSFYFKNKINYIQILKVLSLSVIISFGLVLLINSLNYFKYNKFINNDFNNGNYLKAYGGLISLKVNYEKRNPFPKEKREMAYKVSPTFKKVKKYLEGEVGKSWSSLLDGKPHKKKDTTYWTMWAIRDAIFKEFAPQNAADADRIYTQIYQEIKKYCKKNKKYCRKNNKSLLPNYPKAEYKNIILTGIEGLRKLILLDFNFSGKTESPSKHFNDFEYMFKSFNSNLASPKINKYIRTGWIGYNSDFTISLSNKIKNEIYELKFNNNQIELIKKEINKNKINYKNFKRFVFITDCKSCDLIMMIYDKKYEVRQDKGAIFKDKDYLIYLDEISASVDEYYSKKNDIYLSVQTYLIKFLQIFSIPLLLLSIIYLIKQNSLFSYFVLLITFSLISTRVLMLSIVEELIFVNNLSVLRLYPLTPFLMILHGIGFYYLFHLLKHYILLNKVFKIS
jgi:hypothetical protein